MNTVLLGKTVKAMYKLSGKTLTQLADETGLTVDTLNNLFYARLQKPSFLGVSALVSATGYTVAELDGFMAHAEKLPADADITEEFTKYIFSVKETAPSVLPASTCKKTAGGTVSHEDCCLQVKTMNEEHEHQLDRFRATHLHYVEQLNESHKEQLAQLEEFNRRLKEHYDHSVGEIKKAHAQEIDRLEQEMRHLKRLNWMLIAALIAAAAAVIAISLLLRRG